MSKQIDERVVSMEFDNRQFEKNVQTSLSTLDKLKQKLNLDGASKGLDNVSSAAKKVNLSSLSNSIETVRSKFSALEVMGVTALANITNSAVNAGKRFVSSLTVAPVKDGFQEYEMTLNAVQTTMAGTGKTAKEVEKELKKLDEYADKTVYSTSDMLNNLPKFTNAGVELEKATTAMIGIANATALAGGDARQASIAFYNLGQSIGTGYLTRMDYNSINNAGIATMEWKNQMIEAAIAQGTLTKTGEDAYVAGNKTYTLQQLFIDGLQEQWATASVLTKVFGDYGDETTEIGKKAFSAAKDVKTFTQMMESLKATAGTGWKDTWQLIVGDLDKAKKFWTKINNFIGGIIEKTSDFRNKLLGGALGNPFQSFLDKLDNSSLGKTVEAVSNLANGLEYYQKVVDDVWRGDYKNSDTGRFELLEKAGYNHKVIQDLVNKGYKYKLTMEDVAESEKKFGVNLSETSEEIKKVSSSLENLSDEQLKNAGLTDEEIKMYRELEEQSKKTGKSMKDLVDEMSTKDGRTLLIETFENVGKSIVTIINSIKEAWTDIFPPMTSVQLYNIIKAINEFSKKLIMSEDNAKKLKQTFKGLFAILDIIGKVVGGVLKAAFKIFGNVLKVIFGDTEHNILDLTASVGDAIVKFRDWLTINNMITKVLQKVVDVCTRCIKAVVGWIKSFMELPIVQKSIEKLKETFSSTFKSITEWFDKLKTSDNIPRDILLGLVNGLKNGAILVWNAMIEIGKTVLEAIKNVLGIHSPSTETYKIGENTIAGFVNAIKDGLKKVGEVCAKVFNVVKEKLGDVNWRNVFAIGMVVAIGIFVKKFLDILEKFAGPFEAVTELVEGFAGIGKSITNIFNSLALSLKSKALLNAAISIGVLAASIALLTFVDQDKIWTSVLALGALAAVLAGLTFAIGFMVKWAGKEKGGAGAMAAIAAFLLSFGVAMMLLAWCIKIVSNIPPDGLKNGIEVLGLFAVMITALVAVSAIAGGYASKAGGMILKISVAMLILLAVAKIAANIPKDEMERGTQAILTFTGMVVALIAVSAIARKYANKAGAMILKISIALLLLVGVAKIAANIPKDEMERGTQAILAFEGMIVALIAVSLLAGKNAGKAGRMILSISIALLLLVGAAKIAANIPKDEMERGTQAILAFEGMIVALIAVSLLAGKNASKAGTMILKISVALLIMAGVIAILSLLDPSGLKRAVQSIAILMACMTAIIAVTKLASNAKGAVALLTVIMAGIVGALWLVSTIPYESLTPAVIALASMLAILAIAMAIIGDIKFDKTSISGILSMALLLGVVAGALRILKDSKWDSMLASAIALSAVLLALAGAMRIISNGSGLSMKDAASMLILSASLIAIAGALWVLAKIPVGPLFIAVGAIAALLGVLVLFSWLAGMVIPGIAALSGILLSFASVIISFGVAALAFAASIYIIAKALPSLADGLVHLVKALARVKDYAGDFFITMLAVAGGLALFSAAAVIAAVGVVILAAGFLIIGAAALIFAAAFALIAITLPVAAKGLMALGDAIAYVAGYKDQADAFLGVMLKLALGMAAVGAALMVVGIGAIVLGAGVLVLSVALIVAGAAAIVFALGIAAVSLALLAVASVMPILVTSVANCKDQMDAFSSVMLTVGASILAALVLISTGLAVVGACAIIAAAGIIVLAAGLLIGSLSVLVLAGSLTLLGASLKLTGDGLLYLWEVIKTIAGDLLGIAEKAWEGAKNFIGGFVQGIGDAVKDAVNAVKEFCGTIVGKVKEFLGIHSPSTVMASLAEDTVAGYVKGIKDSAPEAEKAMSGLSKAVTDEMAEGLDGTDAVLYDLTNVLTELINTLKESGSSAGSGFMNGLNTNLDLSKFTSGNFDLSGMTSMFSTAGTDSGMGFMEGLNTNMDFSQFISGEGSGFDLSSITSQFSAAGTDSGMGFMEGLNTNMDFSQFTSGEGNGFDLSSITSQFSTAGTDSGMGFMNGLNGSLNTEEMTSAGANTMQAFADGANSKSPEAEKVFTDVLLKIKNDIDTFAKNFNRSGSDMIESIFEVMSKASSKSEKAGEMLITKFIFGINSRKAIASNLFSSIISNILSSIRTKYSSFHEAGTNMAAGFADGIKDSIWLVTLKAEAMAQAAVDAAREVLAINSPSRVFYGIGEYAGEGLVDGLEDYAVKVYKTGSEIGSKATIGLQNAIAKISDVVNSDIDAQPTIRPVIDLDEVTAGANAINGMFSMTPSVGVLSNIGSISSMMNSRQNGVNNDVVSAIENLGRRLGNSGDTYNINGVTYDDGSNVSNAVQALIRAARIERRT